MRWAGLRKKREVDTSLTTIITVNNNTAIKDDDDSVLSILSPSRDRT
jgi:hypothetical protein